MHRCLVVGSVGRGSRSDDAQRLVAGVGQSRRKYLPTLNDRDMEQNDCAYRTVQPHEGVISACSVRAGKGEIRQRRLSLSICTAVSAATAVQQWTDLPSGASDHTLHVWRWVIPRTEPDADNMTREKRVRSASRCAFMPHIAIFD
jgi:hypothetical protein